MNARLIFIFLLSGALVVPARAQENANGHTPNSVVAHSKRQQPSSTQPRPSQMLAPARSPDAQVHPLGDSDSREGTITIDVWSSVPSVEVEPNEAEATKLSANFTVAALQAAFKMQLTERKIENCIRMGFPIGEFWIQTDLEGIDDALTLAGISATNDTDREALQQLQEQSGRLRDWSSWLIDANHKLQLGDYLTSSWALDNDERFQSTVACTKFLVSMLASRRLAEDNSCL